MEGANESTELRRHPQHMKKVYRSNFNYEGSKIYLRINNSPCWLLCSLNLSCVDDQLVLHLCTTVVFT